MASSPSVAECYELEIAGERLVVLSVPAGPSSSLGDLTPGQREVLALLMAGRSNREIAEQRGTRVRTVANQVASLFRAFGVSGRAELMAHLLGEK